MRCLVATWCKQERAGDQGALTPSPVVRALPCAPAGKSVLVTKYLYALPADGYVPPNVIGFSARTTANMTQYLIDAKLDRRCAMHLGLGLG